MADTVVLILVLSVSLVIAGMPNQRNATSPWQYARNRIVHSYMEKLYNRVQINPNGSFTLSVRKRLVVIDSIEGFEPSNSRGLKNQTRNVHLTFKIRNNYTSLNLVAAELVMTTKLHGLTAAQTMVHVYGGRGSSSQHLDSRAMPQISNAAFSLDVKQAFAAQSSPADKGDKLKLLIRLGSFDKNGTAIFASLDIWRCLHHGHKNGPYLVLYTSASSDGGKSLLQSLFKVSPSILAQNTFTRDQAGKGNITNRSLSKLCHLAPLSVNMQRVLPSIIVPKVAQVNYCIGYCTFPISNHLTPTNHAIIMAILYRSQSTSSAYKKPLCVPNKLTGTSVMYYDDSNKVVVEQWKNMVAKQCGCR